MNKIFGLCAALAATPVMSQDMSAMAECEGNGITASVQFLKSSEGLEFAYAEINRDENKMIAISDNYNELLDDIIRVCEMDVSPSSNFYDVPKDYQLKLK